MKKVLRRKEAKKMGLKRYYSGKICPYSHNDYRYVSTGRCVICVRNSKEQWQTKNPEKVKAYSKAYYAKNKEKILDNFRKWVIENPEKFKETQKNWHRKNPQKRRQHEAKRRAAKIASKDHYTQQDVLEVMARQQERCIYCSRNVVSGFDIDHITPLSRGGSNGKENIQVLCSSCNKKKYNFTHEEYLNKLNNKGE